MIRRRLGKTGLDVGVVGLGAAHVERMSPEEHERFAEFVVSKRINFLDTARGYGDSEVWLGRLLGDKRPEFIIATKTAARDRDGALQHLEESLGRLRTDRVDIWQLHGVMDQGNLKAVLGPGGAIEAMQKAKEEGTVRFIGITSHYPTIVVQALKEACFDTIQVPFNVMRRQLGEDPAVGLFEMARRLDVGIIIMKPVASGRITRNLATAVKFVLAHPIDVIIPGAASLSELEADISAEEEFEKLSWREQERFRQTGTILGDGYCRECGYCLPCKPSGLDIPALLRVERYCTTFGLTEWIREEVASLKVDTSKCPNCGECERECPFDLPIRDMLEASKPFTAVAQATSAP